MMNKMFLVVLLGLLLGPQEDALASASTTWQAAYASMTQSIGTGADTDSKSTTRPTFDAGNFVLKSELAGLGNSSHEYDKIYAIIAEKKYENGACLRPVQISCWANYGWQDDTSHTRYKAVDSIATECQNFCADGYYGDTCSQKMDDNAKEVTPATGSWQGASYSFSGYTGDTKYEESLSSAMYLYAYKWYNNQETDIVLGVTKFLPNGVKVAPVTVVCGSRRKKKDDHIFVKIKSDISGEVLLCSEGYVPNAGKTDCVLRNSDDVAGVIVQNENGSFTKSTDENTMSLNDSLRAKPGFDENIHQIVDTGSTLAIKCKNSLYGFASPDSLECVECVKGNSKRSGVARPDNGVGYGVCVECDLGEVFNTTSFVCEKAVGLSKSDMQYGQDERTKSKLAIEQCWTKTSDAQKYKDCIFGQADETK